MCPVIRLQNHILNELAYKTRSNETITLTLDTSVLNQVANEREYWKSVLNRIVAVIKLLGGLPFRGADQTCGSIRNGNFLGILLDLLTSNIFFKFRLESLEGSAP